MMAMDEDAGPFTGDDLSPESPTPMYADRTDPITEEIVAHLRERILILIVEDQKFVQAVMPEVLAAWKSSEMLDMYINRAFARALILEM